MMDQVQLTATNILSDFRSGSSLPVLAETAQGPRCVVKWKGSGEGPLANAVDWICLHFAHLAGIPVPTPHLITIGSDLIDKSRDPDINDLITRSLGANLGVEFIEDSTPFKPSRVDTIDPALKSRIYLFDVLFLNIDRTDHNPNMVISGDALYCIDFAVAMSVRMLTSKQTYSEQSLLSLVRRHPFYGKSSEIALPRFAINANAVDEIVKSIPDEWLIDPEATKRTLAAGIKRIAEDAHSILERRLTVLDSLPLESAESIKERTLKNRRAFETRWGKL